MSIKASFVLAVSSLCINAHIALAGFVVNSGTSFFGGGVITAPSLSLLDVTLYSPISGAPSYATFFTLTWYTPAGVVARTDTIRANAFAQISIAPPAGAAPNGGYVEFVGDSYPTTLPLRISWYRTAFSYFGVSNGIHPLGLPGITSPQSWSFISPTNTFGTLPLPNQLGGGTLSATVVASNFDLSYTKTGPESYEAAITGDGSYMQLVNSAFLSNPGLANNGFLQFPAGTDFGSLEYVTSSSGTFDFSAIGISGTWTYDPGDNLTTGTITNSAGFAADAVAGTEVAVPAPSIGLPVFLAIGGVFVCTKRLKLSRKRRPLETAIPHAAGDDVSETRTLA